MVRRYSIAVAVGVLALGGSGWLASAAVASPAVEHDTIAVVGAGISVVESLDEQGNANQTTVAAQDSQAAEHDSNTQEHNSDAQEGNSGTNEDGSANASTGQVSDNHDQTGDVGHHETGPANTDNANTNDGASGPSATNS